MVLAVCTSLAIPSSAWLRSCWTVVVIEFRFCATVCAALTTAACAEYELGLVDKACKAPVKLSKTPSNELDDPGVP